MDQVIRNFEEALEFHKRMIRRARGWAIISCIVGIGAIVVAILLFGDDDPAKQITQVAGTILSAIGLAWPLREMYNIKNRMDALELFHGRYKGPPEPSPADKQVIKQKVDEIIAKSL